MMPRVQQWHAPSARRALGLKRRRQRARSSAAAPLLHPDAPERAAFLPAAQATMTATENRHLRAAGHQNGGAMAEASTVEDVFDDTYREKDGPKPAMRLVWRNIILMSLLHVGALYGLLLLPSASASTLAWSEYSPHTRGLGWADRRGFPSPTAECAGVVGSGVWEPDLWDLCWERVGMSHHGPDGPQQSTRQPVGAQSLKPQSFWGLCLMQWEQNSTTGA